MKNRLNITVDKMLMEEAKLFAAKHKTSLSALVEEYFKRLTSKKPAKKENIIDFMAKLPKPKGKNIERYSKETYYEDNKKKYGF